MYERVSAFRCLISTLIMHIHRQLVLALILALTLNDTVHTGKIIGGRDVEKNGRPYMVLVEMTKPNGKNTYCGGFLLSKDFVMTAAHCNSSSPRVFVGVQDFQNQKTVKPIPVKKSFRHEDYDINEYRNDLMLLKLESEVEFSHSVAVIPLAGLGDNPSKSCIVSGWGRDFNTKGMSHVLKEVSVTLINKNPCENDYFYCSDGICGPAEGDSGGPLICDGKAYGVVSFYYANGSIPDTRCYAKIPKARDWIDSIMNSN